MTAVRAAWYTRTPLGTFTDNPVLQKELRSQLRARRQSQGVRLATLLLAGGIVLLLYYYGGRAILQSASNARDLFLAMVAIQLTLVLFLAPSLTANAITQEREQQTWNALLLSRLTADEIVVGKLVARLLPAFLILLMFMPLGLLSAVVGGVALSTYTLSYLLLVATAVFYAAIGMFCSWAYRRTAAATSAASGVIAFLVIGTYLLYGLWASANPGRGLDAEDFPILWLNPYVSLAVVMNNVTNNTNNTADPMPLIAYLTICIIGTLLLILAMVRRLAQGPKEMEQ